MEKWKSIISCCNYSVSSFGRVRNNKTGRVLKQTPATNGYLHVGLCGKTKDVHHLVAQSFIGLRPDGMVLHHNDKNCENNAAENLSYLSREDHSLKHIKEYNDSMNPKISILVKGVDRTAWYKFLAYCKMSGTTGTETIRKIIAKYIEKQGKD